MRISSYTARMSGAAMRKAFIVLVFAAAIGACATTDSGPPAPRVEVVEAVGFTIIEEARIDGKARQDYSHGLSLLQQDRLQEGIAVLEAVAESEPHLTAPHIDLGIAYHRVGNLEAAEASLQKALTLHPGHPIAHNELGIVYRKIGRFADARTSYEAALDFYPGYHYARRNLAVLCDLYLADLECALDNYEAYMATVTEDDEASMWIADLRQRLGRN